MTDKLLTDERIKEIQDRAITKLSEYTEFYSKQTYYIRFQIERMEKDINALLSHIKAQAEEIMRLKESNFKCDKCKILPVCSTAYMKQCLINNNAHYIPKEE